MEKKSKNEIRDTTSVTPLASRRVFFQGLAAFTAAAWAWAMGRTMADEPATAIAPNPQNGNDATPRSGFDFTPRGDQDTVRRGDGNRGFWEGPQDRDDRRSDREPTYTTYALGEEGSRDRYDRYPPRRYPPSQPTTMALGEEGNGRPTTLALGEEGSSRPSPPPRYTTYALGEEGSYYRRSWRRPSWWGWW